MKRAWDQWLSIVLFYLLVWGMLGLMVWELGADDEQIHKAVLAIIGRCGR